MQHSSFLDYLFSKYDLSFWVKSYLFSGVLTYFLFETNNFGTQFWDIFGIFMLFFNAIFFPISLMVYNGILSFIYGSDTVFIRPILIGFIWYIIKSTFLYIFTIFIAPIGLLFLYIKFRLEKNQFEVYRD